MSFMTLLSLQDEQIEVVTETVQRWCQERHLDINSDDGRAALQAAVAIALTDKWSPADLPAQLRKQLTAYPAKGLQA